MTPRPITDPETALLHPIRRRIMDTLARSPGLGPKRMTKQLGINRGTASHHLGLLERIGLIERHREGKYVYYFPVPQPPSSTATPVFSSSPGSSDALPAPFEEHILALRRARAKEVADLVHQQPGIQQKQISDHLGLSRKVLRDVLDRLVDQDLIMEKRGNGICRYYSTPALGEVLSLLEGSPEQTRTLDWNGPPRDKADPAPPGHEDTA